MAGLVSGQWALNETATLVTDLLRASTSDGILLPSLIVGESFGAKLAMSQTTRMRLETMSKSPHLHRTVAFLKSSIGYAKGDSFDYLVRSNGGIRFLSLASALLCTSSSWFAACTLCTMIRRTAPASLRDDPTMPTERMLQDLLNALSPRLCRTDFANYVSGFQLSLGRLCSLNNDDRHPSAGVIEALVNAFRHLDRLGEDGAGGVGDTVDIRAYSGIPWIAAFTQWTVDEHPTILTVNGETLIGMSSRVTITVNESASTPETVRVVRKIDRPKVLWSGPVGDSAAWTGMVTVKNYGLHRMKDLRLDSAGAQDALLEALPVAIRMVNKRLFPKRLSGNSATPFHPALGYESCRRESPKDNFTQFRSQMFGKPRKLKSALEEYLGTVVDYDDSTTSSGKQTQRFPVLESYLEVLIAQCGCKTCQPEPSDYEDSRLGLEPHEPGTPTDLPSLALWICGKHVSSISLNNRCGVMRFWANLSIITMEILTISLFDCTQDIQLYRPGEALSMSRTKGRFVESVYSCLFSGAGRCFTPWESFCSTAEVLAFATSLIGHNVSEEIESGEWIASANRGQVIFPSILDLGGINSNPLSLGGGPGQLIYQGSKINKIVSKSFPESLTPSTKSDIIEYPTVKSILNLYPQDRLEWQISMTAGAPELFFSGTHTRKMCNPYSVLSTIARSLLVDCTHWDKMALSSSFSEKSSGDDVPEATQECCVFTKAPFYVHGHGRLYSMDTIKDVESHWTMRNVNSEPKDGAPFRIRVFPTAGNDEMRLFAMCSPFPGVVRNNACLQCCVDVCQKAGLDYIVL